MKPPLPATRCRRWPSAFAWGLALVCALGGRAAAQPVPYEPPARFERFGFDEGLPSLRTWDVLQDRRGFLWIATADGLARYDGYRFVVLYDGAGSERADGAPADPLSNGSVHALWEAVDGAIWAGTYRAGLNRLDPETGEVRVYRHDPDDPASLASDAVAAVYESPAEPGVIWVGYYAGAGLDRLDAASGRTTHFEGSPSDPTALPGGTVTALFEDAAGQLWAGTNGGLVEVARGAEGAVAFRRRPLFEDRAEEPSVTAITQGPDGALWVGTGAGVVRLAPDGTRTAFRHDPADPTSLPGDAVASLLVDRRSRVWVGTYDDGIGRYDPRTGGFERYRHRPGAPTGLGRGPVRALYEDRGGVVWAATWGGGLSKTSRNRFGALHAEPVGGLLPGRVTGIAADPDGLWVGMLEGGLTRVDDALGASPGFRHVPPERFGRPGGGFASIVSILPDAGVEGALWLGTSDGVRWYDPATDRVRVYRPGPATLPGAGGVFRLLEACAPGVFWAATEGGLHRFDSADGSWTHVDLPGMALPDRPAGNASVRRIAPSDRAACTYWLSTRDGGLFHLAEGEPGIAPAVRAVPRSAYLPPDVGLRAVAMNVWGETEDGRVWLTAGFGVVAFDPDRWLASGSPAPAFRLFDAELVGGPGAGRLGGTPLLWFDAEGEGWVGYRADLIRFSPRTGEAERFGPQDGLHGGPFWQWALATGPDGTVYAGGWDGLSIVPAQAPPAPQVPPAIVFTDVDVDGQPVGTALTGQRGELRLGPAAHAFTATFAALDFGVPGANGYAYRLVGFDDAWRDAGAEHQATYTNLDPGRYTLEVRGRNADGTWSAEPARLAVVVLPPWYRTWWAYALFAALAAGAAVGVVRLRERRLRRRADRLEATVAERTAELEAQRSRLAEQAHQLQQLDEAKGRFFANLSHEFRTPLTLLLGPLADALAGRYDSFERAAPHFERAHANGQRLLRLINQLLDLARADAGHLAFSPQRHDLAALVRHSAAAFATVAEQGGLGFDVEAPDRPLAHVFDREHVETVLANLLSNAVKFTPEGGQIALRVDRRADGAAVLEVSDTGVGVAPEAVPHLFDRFYQVDDAPTRWAEGTGIGLALVKELVEAHGGTVAAASAVGEGTTFTVVLPPLTAGPAEPAAQSLDTAAVAHDEPPLLSGDGAAVMPGLLTVAASGDGTAGLPPCTERPLALVVDDNADLRAYVGSLLADTFEVAEAADGQEGLDAARERVPDLIVSDVMMPRLDGFGLLDALRADRVTCHVPVLMLTARADQAGRLQGLGSGAEAYVTKPFDGEELRVRAAALVARQAQLREALHAARQTSAPPPVAEDTPPAEPVQGLTTLDEAFLRDVDAAIAAGLSDASFGVDQVAEAVAMSRTQLHRKLGALAGETPGALLRERRLERAAKLLTEEGRSVKEAAAAVGFRNRSSFSRAFQEHFGHPPSEAAA